MDAVTKSLQVLWRHRDVLAQTTRSDIRARYAGSLLGLGWLFALPLLVLGAYSVVYVAIFRIRLGTLDSPSYVAMIFCGLIPFLCFSESLALGVGSVVANRGLIKNTLFPIQLIPVKAVLASQPSQIVSLGLLLAWLTVIGRASPSWLCLPLLLILQLLFSIGVVWGLSSTNVLLRDMQNAIPIITLVLMIVSPIAYTPDMVPQRMHLVVLLNPLYYVITAYRECLFEGRFPSAGVFWPLVGISVGTFGAGAWYFDRLKRVFADNV